MGSRLIDQYSLLHFAVGIIAYFWGFSAWFVIVGHLMFELIENTEKGMFFINRYITLWPGGKPKADSVPNSIMDTLSTMFGWFLARIADSISKEAHLYP
jgi:hypothetical protein